MTDSTPPAVLPRLVGVETLAKEWALKPTTIRAMARRGDIPSVKVGRLTMFRVSELAAWLDSRPTAKGAA